MQDQPHYQGEGLPEMPNKIYLGNQEKPKIDWKRIFFLFLGFGIFCGVNFSPDWADAVDPAGKHFVLSQQGKAAIGLFLMTAIWWVTEVIPIGVTSITVGVVQALFLIREPKVVFNDFMDPSVWFIFASLTVGLAFSKSGLTKRLAYKMLALVGEKTSMIYLGSYIMVALLTFIMAHTAVAAAMFPLLMTIYSLYDPHGKPSKFGKGLFMGMAFVAGAGSIVTLLGAARGAVALGFYSEMSAKLGDSFKEITFFELTYYMLPLGLLMVFLCWVFFMIFFKPEKDRIPGLKDKVKILSKNLGRIKRDEILTLVVVFSAVAVLSLRSFIPELGALNKSAVLLVTTVLFFIFKILDIKDLENIPWNIILLFGGAMCIGFCLWQTGAANWLAVNWLVMFQDAHWFVFVMGITLFVLIMTNLIMNVAAISIILPVALVIAPYLGVSPEVILFCALAAAGMPFLLLVGAAPNAIAYESRQFTSGQFFVAGIPMSIVLMLAIGLFVWKIWPMMGMTITL
ncbi:MAG: SLC13/DASS family transporter [Chlorobi bacterium]|nr:SLC13/DASS family transporter [Chlorobiota bacterium]